MILYAREILSPIENRIKSRKLKESYQKASDEFRVLAAELAIVNRKLFWLRKEKKEQNEKALYI